MINLIAGQTFISAKPFLQPDGSISVGSKVGTTVGSIERESNLPNSRPPTILYSGEAVTIVGDNAENEYDTIARRRLKRLFYLTAVINVLVTSILYIYYFIVITESFGRPLAWSSLTVVEAQLLITYAICLFGIVAVNRENSTMISLYCIAVTCFYFITIRYVPFFLYIVRFLADFSSIYVAMKLRKRLVSSIIYSFL